MFIKPMMDRVLIKPIEVENKIGSIVLAGDTKVDYLHGLVIALGPGKQKANGEYVPIPLEIGQKVIYGNVSSTLEDMEEGTKVLLVEQNAIVGILLESKPRPNALRAGLDDQSEYSQLAAHIPENKVSEEPLQEVYKDDMQSLVPRTPSTNYIGTKDE